MIDNEWFHKFFNIFMCVKEREKNRQLSKNNFLFQMLIMYELEVTCAHKGSASFHNGDIIQK